MTTAPAHDNRDLYGSGISDYLQTNQQKQKLRSAATVVLPDAGSATGKATNHVAGTSGGSRVKTAQTGNDYGARKRNPVSAADAKDRIMNLEKENNVLKAKENLLRQEVTKMQTKLHRIDGLIRSRAHSGGEGTYDVRDMQRDLKEEFEELKDKNQQTKERVRKLNVIQRGLASRPATAAKPNKYAHVQGKLDVNMSAAAKQYSKLAEELRAQMVVNQRETLRLQQEVNLMNERTNGMGGPGSVDKIKNEILQMQQDMREVNTEIETLQGNFASNETKFREAKNYIGSVQEQIRQVAATNDKLRHENFKLQLVTNEATEVENEIRGIEEERDKLERHVRNMSTEPFMRKPGQSVANRVADLELKNKEKGAIASQLKAEEAKKSTEAAKLKAELQKLLGERDYLLGEHGKVSSEFQASAANRQLNQGDAIKGLMDADAGKYSQTMTDLAMGFDGAEPVWARLPFLERHTAATDSSNPKQQLQTEIEALRQEKSEFAAELEKATRLLTLQKDIERENLVYFQQEKQRLALIERSATAKAEELAVRADDKQKTLNEMLRKSTHAQGASDWAVARNADTLSEFSAVSNESEVRADENILDFKIEDAEFYSAGFQQVAELAGAYDAANPRRPFITLCTVDFYNHGTETSQMADGLRPNYQTQMSFKNKVDDFYVACLQKQSLRIDVYHSRDNSAVHMGRAEVMLKELVEREVATGEALSKPPLIQRWAQVFPVGSSESQPLGTIKYKIRLRKPIGEQMRYFREKAEIANMSRAAAVGGSSLQPPKRLVSISVVGASNLKVRYGDTRDIAPFFYYQFFTFDERYSQNAAGASPQFKDTFSYEVSLDARAVEFFEKESLEIILFDDNAPIAGVGPEAQAQGDDMIGVCKVPLKSLVAGCSVHDRFPLRAAGSSDVVGELEVKLSSTDLGASLKQSQWQQAVSEVQYTKEWESEVVFLIARRLAKVNVGVDLLFGLFSNGMRTATKEDFKHCLLYKLNLNKELSEKEVDLLLLGNEYLSAKNYVEKDDFLAVFREPLEQASYQLQQQPAQEDMSDLNERDRTFGASRVQMATVYNETEVLQLMATAVCQGAQQRMLTEAGKKVRLNEISAVDLQQVLRREAMLGQLDGKKVCQALEADGKIDYQRFESLVRRGAQFARDSSAALRRFMSLFVQHGRALVKRFESQDHNKDGLLNVDGFRAACLLPEIGMAGAELDEAFWLCENFNGQLSYREWISDNFPAIKDQLTITSAGRDVHRPESSLTGRETVIERSLNDRTITPEVAQNGSAQVLAQAKAKMENYIRAKDINLGIMFSILDTDSNTRITRSEFRQKMRALHMQLDDEEIGAIFKSLDMNADGAVGYAELVEQFAAINTQQLIRKMQRVIAGSKVEPEFFFTRHCVSDGTRTKMSRADFDRMVKDLYEKVTKPEITYVFRHFDKGQKGYVTKGDFLAAFHAEVRETHQGFQVGVEDIIKPLATKVRKLRVDVGAIFDRYDKNRNFRLSAEELRDGLRSQGVNLQEEEVRIIREFFVHKYRSDEISKQHFMELLSTRFERKVDQVEAKKALADVRAGLETARVSAKKLVSDFNTEATELVNVRSFKLALNSLKVLSQYNIDNLAKHLDKNNEGFISIGHFEAEVKAAATTTQGSFRATMASTGRSNKWGAK